MRFQIELPDRVAAVRGGVLSPGGQKTVFPAVGADGERRLWLGSVGSLEARVLPMGGPYG